MLLLSRSGTRNIALIYNHFNYTDCFAIHIKIFNTVYKMFICRISFAMLQYQNNNKHCYMYIYTIALFLELYTFYFLTQHLSNL